MRRVGKGTLIAWDEYLGEIQTLLNEDRIAEAAVKIQNLRNGIQRKI